MNTQLTEPLRAEIDQFKGAVLLEFGAEWCGYCRAAQSMITAELTLRSGVHHIKIEDGKGRRLGRTFAVKLWPTLIFLKDGVELKRLVRSFSSEEMSAALAVIAE